MPGFALVLYPARYRPAKRILAIVDRTDAPPSGLLVMIAVGAGALDQCVLERVVGRLLLLVAEPVEELDPYDPSIGILPPLDLQ